MKPARDGADCQPWTAAVQGGPRSQLHVAPTGAHKYLDAQSVLVLHQLTSQHRHPPAGQPGEKTRWTPPVGYPCLDTVACCNEMLPSVNEEKRLMMHVHVQMRLDELQGPPEDCGL